MEYMKSILPFLLILLITFPAQSAIIDMGDYQYDDVSQLEWLDLTFTIGNSRSQALAAYSSDGWEIANESQFHEMYSQYDGTAADGSVYGHADGYRVWTDRGYESATTTDFDTIAEWGYIPFVEDFGLTQDISANLNSSGAIDLFVQRSLGFYDTDDNAEMSFGGLVITVHTGEYKTTSDELLNVYDYYATYSQSDTNSIVGFFMVRKSEQVSEPSILVLMFTGFLGLGIVRRKARKS